MFAERTLAERTFAERTLNSFAERTLSELMPSKPELVVSPKLGQGLVEASLNHSLSVS
jgi:hypothetical protein